MAVALILWTVIGSSEGFGGRVQDPGFSGQGSCPS